jgi:putative FmdB family regulatory protein
MSGGPWSVLVPTYAYRCTVCDHAFDQQQSFTDDALTVCPRCAGRLRKVFSPVGVVFKGSGFYRTDARAGGRPTASVAASNPSTSGSDSGTNGSGSESKGSGAQGSDGAGSKGSAGAGSNGPGGSGSTSAGSAGSGASSSTSAAKAAAS